MIGLTIDDPEDHSVLAIYSAQYFWVCMDQLQ